MGINVKTRVKIIPQLDAIVKPMKEILIITEDSDSKTKEIVNGLYEAFNRICLHMVLPETNDKNRI